MWKDKTTRQDGDKEEKLINYHRKIAGMLLQM